MASQAELSRIKANPELSSLYLPSEKDNKDYGTPFFRPFKQVLWHSGTPIRLEIANTSESSDGLYTTISYRVSSGVSVDGNKTKLRFYSNRYLFTTTAKFPFPGIKVKPEHVGKVRIAWCRDAPIYYCHRSEFKINEVVYDSLTSSWIDDYYSWNRDCPLDDFNESVLNLPHMLEWSQELKPDIAEYVLPHFYSYSHASSFPLFLVDENMKVYQEITFPKNIAAHLLRVQVLDGDDWIPVEFNDVKSLLDVDKAGLPVLLCDFLDISPEEADQNRTEDVITIPIQRVISMQRSNTTKGGISDEISISGSDPVVAVFVKAKNVEAVKYNDRGNCVDTLEETSTSKFSLSTLKMNYGQVEKFCYHQEDVRSNRMLRFFSSIPYRRGRYAHAFSINPFNPVKLAGMYPDSELKCVLSCLMTGKKSEQVLDDVSEEQDIISSILARNRHRSMEKEESELASSYYRPEVNLLTHNDLVFTKNDNGTYDIKLH